MDLYRSLFELTKLLVAEETGPETARAVLERLLQATGAKRGFIVVREGEAFEQKFDVRYDRERLPVDVRRFSRGLVRHVLENGEMLDLPEPGLDPRFAGLESVRLGGAVLVVPLRHAGEIWGVLYLERGGRGRFTEGARQLLGEIAPLAGLFLRRALEREALRERNRSLERDLFARFSFPGIVTQDPGMLRLLQAVAQVADSEAPVLLLGESGTGKELLAQALHLNSPRAGKPFVPLHCAALPSNVLEAELFGHTRGAFTGAEKERRGRIATAHGGTLLLDEVAEIPPEVQAKLLRFLQFGEIQRVGSDKIETVDVRVLAATHANLGALVAAGRFRQDLYFRLQVIELRIPPLRERPGDVPLLVAHFLAKHWKRSEAAPRFSARAEKALSGHRWPGNVRELEHVVQRACLLARGPELEVELPASGVGATDGAVVSPVQLEALTNDALKAARAQAVDEVERTFLGALLERHGGSVTAAALAAGLQRTYLQRLLARHRRPEA